MGANVSIFIGYICYYVGMLKKLKAPVIGIVGFGALILLWKILKLPPEEQLIEIMRGYFLQYGLITVFVASLIESMLLVGVYLPGGLVIFLGVILSAGNPTQATLSVVMTMLGFSIGYAVNYFLGKYGWYRVLTKFGLSESLILAQDQFAKHGYKAIWLSYWQPNLGAFVSTAAGILKAPLKKFLPASVSAAIIWCVFWGTLAYFLGTKVLDYLGPFFLVIMVGWIVSIVVQEYILQKDQM